MGYVVNSREKLKEPSCNGLKKGTVLKRKRRPKNSERFVWISQRRDWWSMPFLDAF